MPLIDSHAHLDFPEFDNDLNVVLERAEKMGVNKIINVGADLARSKKAIEIANLHDNIWATAGIHPEDCNIDLVLAKNELTNLVNLSKKIVAIGECGLDYFCDNPQKTKQQSLFELQIDLAQTFNLPIVIHIRNGLDDAAVINGFKLLKESKVRRGVVHCFTLDKHWAKKFIDLGLYIGFTGIVTYKNAELVRESAKSIPLERLLIETDCPYLAPQLYRGKRNEPAYVVEVAKQISEIREESLEEVMIQTTKNTELLFNI